MSFKTTNTDQEQAELTQEQYEALPYVERRRMHYKEAGDDDIGMLYDMIAKLKSVLDDNDITVDFGDDQWILDHRAAVKSACPKPSSE